ncbi:MAG: DUF4358 domain-containing protein [Clostridiaceae bacterium]|nr:DUF4358 domain-containing protein [Eubacteriales bacterium]MDD4140928.1 DUF4358 domain-containing protein [Eubacteriales bacterium]MDD4745154.1 DUF4358 domain-containing protein [Eubacteriales bacterium]NLB44704.1 DUF4358 domain-containing protein [Clostridiaceae bacterium]
MKRFTSFILAACLAVLTLAACAPKAPSQTTGAGVDEIVAAFKARMVDDAKADNMTEEDLFGKGDEMMGAYFTEDMTVPADQRRIAVDVKSEDLAAGTGIQATFNVNAAQILVLEAASADKVETIKTALNTMLDQQKELWSQYLPDQYEIVKKTVLKSEGNLIVYITYVNADALEAIFDELAG